MLVSGRPFRLSPMFEGKERRLHLKDASLR